MASKRLQASAADRAFNEAFASLAITVQEGEPLDRLLAVDLLVRMPAVAKNLERAAAGLPKTALKHPIPPAWIVPDTTTLPASAKLTEVRENVAQGLGPRVGRVVTTILSSGPSPRRSIPAVPFGIVPANARPKSQGRRSGPRPGTGALAGDPP
jgi:hypothetical protein